MNLSNFRSELEAIKDSDNATHTGAALKSTSGLPMTFNRGSFPKGTYNVKFSAKMTSGPFSFPLGNFEIADFTTVGKI